MPDYLKVILNHLVLTIMFNHSLKTIFCRIKVQNAVGMASVSIMAILLKSTKYLFFS